MVCFEQNSWMWVVLSVPMSCKSDFDFPFWKISKSRQKIFEKFFWKVWFSIYQTVLPAVLSLSVGLSVGLLPCSFVKSCEESIPCLARTVGWNCIMHFWHVQCAVRRMHSIALNWSKTHSIRCWWLRPVCSLSGWNLPCTDTLFCTLLPIVPTNAEPLSCGVWRAS